MASSSASSSAEEALRKAERAWEPSPLSFRLKPDWETAGPLFERASLLFKQSNDLPRAISSLERASQCQEKLGSPWHAAKHLESCAAMSAQLAPASAAGAGAQPSAPAADASQQFARRAAALFAEGGRASAGAEALGRCAKLLEARGAARHAAELYDDALDMAEADGREAGAAAASDLYRAAVALALARGRWAEAASLGLRLGEACDRAGARASQARAYLGAIVAYLHAGDAAAAWATFQDVLPTAGGFASCEEARAAGALFDAYREGAGGAEKGAAAVRAAVARCAVLKTLDGPAARLAVKLPSPGSDLVSMAAALGRGSGGGGGGAQGGGEGEDEEDIT